MRIKEKVFPLLPAGFHNEAFADYFDMGVLPGPYPKPTIKMIFVSDVLDPETGLPMEFEVLVSKTLGSSKQPSKLRKILAALIHPQPLPKDLELDDYIGHNCTMNIVHVTKDGKTYANMDSCGPYDQRDPWLPISTYQRRTPAAGAFSDNSAVDDKVRRSIAANQETDTPLR